MKSRYWVQANHRRSGPFYERRLAEEFAVKVAPQISVDHYQEVLIITEEVDEDEDDEEEPEVFLGREIAN